MKEVSWSLARQAMEYQNLQAAGAYDVHKHITKFLSKNSYRLEGAFDEVDKIRQFIWAKYAVCEKDSEGTVSIKVVDGVKQWKYDGAEQDAINELDELTSEKETIRMHTVSGDLLLQSKEWPNANILKAIDWFFDDAPYVEDVKKREVPDYMLEMIASVPYAEGQDPEAEEASEADENEPKEDAEDDDPVGSTAGLSKRKK